MNRNRKTQQSRLQLERAAREASPRPSRPVLRGLLQGERGHVMERPFQQAAVHGLL